MSVMIKNAYENISQIKASLSEVRTLSSVCGDGGSVGTTKDFVPKIKVYEKLKHI